MTLESLLTRNEYRVFLCWSAFVKKGKQMKTDNVSYDYQKVLNLLSQ